MNHLLVKILCLAVMCFMAGTDGLAQQQKFALIIGVKSYEYVAPLQNSLNDAHDIANTLRKKGFTLIELYDPATKRVMQEGIIKYFKMLQAQPKAAGLVFYSGHGMQVRGVNYLIPAQANPQIEADLDDQCVNMDYVMRAIEQAGNELNIFILDACRNNPFRSFSRSGEKGLSMVDTPKGSYIVYATKPGSVASDGTGRNGLFTSRLLQYINTEGLNIEQVFKRTAHDVATASGDAQRPWIASDYTGDFFFTPGTDSSTHAPTTTPRVVPEQTKSDARPEAASEPDSGSGPTELRTVTVGTQEWLGKNLSVDHFANGDIIPEAKTAEEWKLASLYNQPAWCYYENDPANGSRYGRLYNWYAVTDHRGLAPKGWHVPSDSEWDILIKHLAGKVAQVNKRVKTALSTYYVTEEVGRLLKSPSGWNENGNGTNGSGLAGLPGGLRHIDGVFYNLGKNGIWWSSSDKATDSAWDRSTTNLSSVVSRELNSKGVGFSVRCLRD